MRTIEEVRQWLIDQTLPERSSSGGLIIPGSGERFRREVLDFIDSTEICNHKALQYEKHYGPNKTARVNLVCPTCFQQIGDIRPAGWRLPD